MAIIGPGCLGTTDPTMALIGPVCPGTKAKTMPMNNHGSFKVLMTCNHGSNSAIE